MNPNITPWRHDSPSVAPPRQPAVRLPSRTAKALACKMHHYACCPPTSAHQNNSSATGTPVAGVEASTVSLQCCKLLESNSSAIC